MSCPLSSRAATVISPCERTTGDLSAAKGLSQSSCLAAAFLAQVALSGAVAQPEMRRVAEARGCGMPDEHDKTPLLEQIPTGRLTADSAFRPHRENAGQHRCSPKNPLYEGLELFFGGPVFGSSGGHGVLQLGGIGSGRWETHKLLPPWPVAAISTACSAGH